MAADTKQSEGSAPSAAQAAMPGIPGIEHAALRILGIESPRARSKANGAEPEPKKSQREEPAEGKSDGVPPAPNGKVNALLSKQRKPTPPPFSPLSDEEVDAAAALSQSELTERVRAVRKKKETGAHPTVSNRAAATNGTGQAQTPAKAKAAEAIPASKASPGQKTTKSGEVAKRGDGPGQDAPSEPEIPDWTSTVFNSNWTLLEPKSAQFHAREDVKFLVKYCGVPRGGKVLDVGCGRGTHARQLASSGFEVVGLDQTRELLNLAVSEANDSKVNVKFVEGDMRSFSFPPAFDAVLCLHSTFGYFSERENLKVLRCMADSLAPGGQLIIDTVSRDWVAQIGARRLWWECRGFLVMEDVAFHDETSRLSVDRTTVESDSQDRVDQKYSIRLYTIPEYRSLFRQVGLELVDTTGSLAHPGVYLGATNHRLILRARRPAN